MILIEVEDDLKVPDRLTHTEVAGSILVKPALQKMIIQEVKALDMEKVGALGIKEVIRLNQCAPL